MEEYYIVLADVLRWLDENEVRPIVFGSIAASFYVGRFKDTFADYDLLVDDKWLAVDWPRFQNILKEMGYELVDEREHEFVNKSVNIRLNFAKLSILERDNICSAADTVDLRVRNNTFRTLSARNLLRAYLFSAKDGYRKNARGKNDREVIALLAEFVRQHDV